MLAILHLLGMLVADLFKPRRQLEVENLFLRHQLTSSTSPSGVHRTVCKENPLWGAPRIHGELLKLGFEIAKSTVSKYMIRHRGPPSQTWQTFLRNHADAIAARRMAGAADVEAFPWDTAPSYLVRDNDGCMYREFHPC